MMIWALTVVTVTVIVVLVMVRREMRTLRYVVKEQGFHLAAVNKVLHLHEVRLNMLRRVNQEIH